MCEDDNENIYKTFFALFLSVLFINKAYSSDWEYWSTYSIKTELADRIDLNIGSEFCLNNKASHFYYNKTTIGPNFKLSKNINISPSYSYKSSENKDSWSDEDIGNFDVKLKVFNSLINYRFRLKYSFTKEEFTGRSRVNFMKEYKKIKRLSFNIQDEIFYSFDQDTLDENRMFFGVNKKINKNLSCDLGYMLRHKKLNDWQSANILTSNLKISF